MKRVLVYGMMILLWVAPVVAQNFVTPTPISVIIPTTSSLPTAISLATVTSTPTPTALPSVTLRAANGSALINVRAEPDPESDRLGVLDPNVNYVIIGRYFSWYQFEYPESRQGVGWVFADLVVVDNANAAFIPDIEDPFGTAPSDDLGLVVVGTGTPEPPIVLTATAEARAIQLPQAPQVQPTVAVTVVQDGRTIILGSSAAVGSGLPTFTPPPDVVPLQDVLGAAGQVVSPSPTPDILANTVTLVVSGGLPPIVPIALLGGAGALGIIFWILRRWVFRLG